jgi:hypothetical protein
MMFYQHFNITFNDFTNCISITGSWIKCWSIRCWSNSRDYSTRIKETKNCVVTLRTWWCFFNIPLDTRTTGTRNGTATHCPCLRLVEKLKSSGELRNLCHLYGNVIGDSGDITTMVLGDFPVRRDCAIPDWSSKGWQRTAKWFIYCFFQIIIS